MSPFLSLVRSPITSGPITSLALASLHSIILNILPLYLAPITFNVTPSTPLQIALAHLTSTLSQCRFPSSSPQQDELVLYRLLRVIDSLLITFPMPSSSSTGTMLDQMADESVCELLEVGLGMLARVRLGEGLRNAAQSSVQAIVRACFARLKGLKKDDVDRLLNAVKESGAETVVHVDAGVSAETKHADRRSEDKPAEAADEAEKAPEMVSEKEPKPSLEIVESKLVKDADRVRKSRGLTLDMTPPSFTPYGLPTILELLRVLIALLNPSDQAHTDSMRLSALAILNTALEVGGATLGNWPELREGVRDEGCRYLFQVNPARYCECEVS